MTNELARLNQEQFEAGQVATSAYNKFIETAKTLWAKTNENLDAYRAHPDYKLLIELQKDYCNKRKESKEAFYAYYNALLEIYGNPTC